MSKKRGVNTFLEILLTLIIGIKERMTACYENKEVLAGGDFIVPIPGMRKEDRIIENLGAVDIELTEEEYAALNKELGKLTIYGTRDGRDIKKMGTIPDSTTK